MEFAKGLYRRFESLVHELAKFGSIGALAFLIDFGLLNLLLWLDWWGPLTCKLAATAVSTTFAYVGNRYWTFRHRDQSGLGREYFLFFLLNGIALLFGILALGFTRYTLNLQDTLSLNIANIVGVALGTLFRYWSYKKWVFLEATEPIPVELPAEPGGITQDR